MKFHYCPNCGHQNTIVEVSKTKYQCTDCDYVYWNNPKASTAIVFLDGDKALFAKRKNDPDKGKFEFPGGFVDYFEDAYDAAVREIKEETGLTVKKGDLHLITAYTSLYEPGTSAVDLVFLLTKWDGEPTASDDVELFEWSPLSFMSDSEFIRPYHDLEAKIKEFLSS